MTPAAVDRAYFGTIFALDGTSSGTLVALAAKLRVAGFDARVLPDEAALWRALAASLPDLILIDPSVSDTHGYEICQRLKASDRSADIPIIFVGALDEPIERLQVFSVGAVDCIARPFQFEEVLARINNQLTMRRLRQQMERQNAQLQAQNAQLQQEIYERIAIEAALQRSNAILQAQNEASIDGILAVDEQGCVTNFNRRFCDMWGIPADLLAPTSRRPLRALLGEIALPEALAHAIVHAIDVAYDDPDGSVRYEIALEGDRTYECYSGPIRASLGKFYGRLWQFTDVTNRVRVQQALEAEKEMSDRLLRGIFPTPIVERLKQTHGAIVQVPGTVAPIADAFDNVTVLFADIVGFTALCNDISPAQLVGLLNRVFSIFDRLAKSYGLEKIKTIGDAYMVVGGLTTRHSDSVARVAAMALDMMAEMRAFRTYENRAVSLRIGIDTGSIVAGVIGMDKFLYDLWGDPVNVANRMEALGVPGRIQVTETVYDALKHRFAFERRGTIYVKGKGDMTTYWLTGSLPAGATAIE